jgi:excisionase family DNA binding protein
MRLLSTSEAANQLGVSERRVRAMIAEGKIAAHRLGRDYAIEEASLASVTVYGKSGRPPKAEAESAPKPQAVKKARAAKGAADGGAKAAKKKGATR